MIRVLLSLCLIAGVVAPATAMVAGTLIDFDDMSSGGSQYGVWIGDHYLNQGVVFTNGYASNYWGSPTSSPTAAYGEDNSEYNGIDAAAVSAYFVVPGTLTATAADYVALSAVWVEPGKSVTLTGFDLYGNVVDSDTQSDPNTNVLYLSVSGDIYSFGVAFGAGDDVAGIDDLMYTGVVPEPGSVTLLGLGIVGVGARFLRRR